MEDLTPGQAAVLARNERHIEQTMVRQLPCWSLSTELGR